MYTMCIVYIGNRYILKKGHQNKQMLENTQQIHVYTRKYACRNEKHYDKTNKFVPCHFSFFLFFSLLLCFIFSWSGLVNLSVFFLSIRYPRRNTTRCIISIVRNPMKYECMISTPGFCRCFALFCCRLKPFYCTVKEIKEQWNEGYSV